MTEAPPRSGAHLLPQGSLRLLPCHVPDLPHLFSCSSPAGTRAASSPARPKTPRKLRLGNFPALLCLSPPSPASCCPLALLPPSCPGTRLLLPLALGGARPGPTANSLVHSCSPLALPAACSVRVAALTSGARTVSPGCQLSAQQPSPQPSVKQRKGPFSLAKHRAACVASSGCFALGRSWAGVFRRPGSRARSGTGKKSPTCLCLSWKGGAVPLAGHQGVACGPGGRPCRRPALFGLWRCPYPSPSSRSSPDPPRMQPSLRER